jgi:hypothetical protein
MAEVGWITSDVTQEHLQQLVGWGYMIEVELTTCRVLKDQTSPISVGGYVVACAAFHERGFGVPSH